MRLVVSYTLKLPLYMYVWSIGLKESISKSFLHSRLKYCMVYVIYRCDTALNQKVQNLGWDCKSFMICLPLSNHPAVIDIFV